MRALTRFIVISPCDSEEGRKATIAAAKLGSPVYMRFGREKTPIVTTPESPFQIGKVNVLWKTDKPQVVIFATGPLVYNALLAARELEKGGVPVTVVNVHTVKPLDEATIAKLAREAGAVVTVEEHQIYGGLGGAIAELLAAQVPTPIEFVGMHDEFGQSGTAAELIEHYGMGMGTIVEAVKKAVRRKIK